MPLMAKIRRLLKDGKVVEAIVNPATVLYVEDKTPGSYITFEHEKGPDPDGVTPMGMASPDTIETVRKRLNCPYIIDTTIRVITLLMSAAGVAVAIWYSSGR